jgi:hypothetical protein
MARPRRFERPTSAFGGQRDALAATGTSRERPSPSTLVPSSCLNLRKNKDKSERMATGFVRVPGMYEAGPRYQGQSVRSEPFARRALRRDDCMRLGPRRG